jgi:hypothetical protein
MFDLDQSISEWRQRMTAVGIKNPAVLDELESHLREDAEREIRSGTSAQQAFNRAIKRIGERAKLAEEFGKIDATKKFRTRILLRRWSAIAGIAFVYSTLAFTWFIGVREGKIELTWLDVAFALGAIAPMLLMGSAGRSLAKVLPIIPQSWVMVITFAALFAGAALLKMFFEGMWPTNLVQVQVITLWALSPMLGFGSCVSAWYDRSLGARQKLGTPNP